MVKVIVIELYSIDGFHVQKPKDIPLDEKRMLDYCAKNCVGKNVLFLRQSDGRPLIEFRYGTTKYRVYQKWF